jgi:AcrR family transcriptional regulator
MAGRTSPISPLYQRLPPGPHRLDRKAVSRNQRLRVHGAMIEAVADYGYQATTVRHVIGLAGVSRRSFYEQFANKEACFLATFDLIAGGALQRMSRAYATASGGLEQRLRAALAEFAEVACTSRKAAALVLLEASTAGPAGERRLGRAIATCERMLARSFSEAPQATALPAPIVTAIAGGLHGAMSDRVRAGAASKSRELAEEMLRWMLAFQNPAAETMSERIAARLARHMRDAPRERQGRQGARALDGGARERLLQNVLRLAVVDDYKRLTEAQIADEAHVPLEVFFELFANRDACFLAALEMIGEELLAIVADPDRRSADWPCAVRRALAELMRFLAARPLYAQTITRSVFLAGPEAIARNLQLGREIAAGLTAGAPAAAQGRLAVEGLAGAIWHTVRCHVTSERARLLPARADYLAYVALAPCIGAEASAELLSADTID